MSRFSNRLGGHGAFCRQSSASHFAGRWRGCRLIALMVLGVSIPGVFVERRASAQDVVANVKTDFRQAANKDSGTCGTGAGHPCGLGHAHWINSIVQQSNARYFEGMSNPQRVIFLDIANTAGSPKEVHTLSFSHQATKGGIHAYDFLTSWAQAQTSAAAFTPPAGGLLFDLFVDNCGAEIGPPASMSATCTGLKGGANCLDVPVPGDLYVDSVDGAYSTRITAYELQFGPRTIQICGDQPITSASLTLCNHSGPDTGDSEISYVLQWNSNSNEIVIKFAGHLSVSGDPNIDPLSWGINQGAGAISGGPYHFNLHDLGGALTAGPPTCTQSDVTSLGSQDNQIKGADIQFCRPGCGDGSTCTNGLCANGSACGTTTCDDGIACTNDTCDETNNVCFHTSNNSKCNDLNECTFNVCDPTNPAANADGCVFTPVSDNTPCTADNVPCTDDICQGGVCTHPPDDTFCDDLRSCTSDKCVPGSGNADGCVFNPNNAACDDGIGCTNDSCDPSHPAANTITGCVNLADDGKCPDDGLFCTPVLVCDAMTGCVPNGPSCFAPTAVCCEATDTCVAECCTNADCPGSFCHPRKCVGGLCVDDTPPCPEDNCDCTTVLCEEANLQCVVVVNHAFCNDNLFCTVDICDPSTGPGTCCVYPTKCDAPLKCDEVNDKCAGCITDDQCPDDSFCNGLETCDEPAGQCVDGPDPCPPDAIACTIENCVEFGGGLGECRNKLDDDACNDGKSCTLDSCTKGGCLYEPKHDRCDDLSECTDDSCDPTNPLAGLDGCVHTPKPSGTACGNQMPSGVCDNSDVCDATGHCTQNPKPAGTLCRPGDVCDPPEFCDGTNKDCPANVCEPAGTSCPDDGNECTDDKCDGLCHCTHPPKPDNTACTGDGNDCTRDVCLSGMCVHPPTPPGAPCGNQTVKGVCDNPNQCDGMGNCVQNAQPAGTLCRAAVNECDLTEFCNGTAKDCPPDECKPAGATCADDGDACTDDECDGFCVCGHIDRCGTPSIVCPPDKLFECDAVGDFGDPTVEDPCNPNAEAVCTEDSTPGKLPLERKIIRTCTYTNDCGNFVSCRQHIDIVDTTAPVVTCPSDRTFECDAIGDFGVPSAVDNCDPTPIITIDVVKVIEDCTPGSVAGPLTPPPKLSITVTASATEGSTAATATGGGNVGMCIQHIDIVDSNPPLLVGCPGPITICAKNDSLPFTPPTCTDTCGTCTVTCVRSDNLPLHDPVPTGPITVTCIAADECVNESSCSFDVQLSESGDCFVVIPTVSEWGLVVLTLLLLTGAKIYFGRRQVDAA